MTPRTLHITASFLRIKSIDDAILINKLMTELTEAKVRDCLVNNAFTHIPVLVNFNKPRSELDFIGISETMTNSYAHIINNPDFNNMSKLVERFVDEGLNEFHIYYSYENNLSMLNVGFYVIGHVLMVSIEPLSCNYEHIERYQFR